MVSGDDVLKLALSHTRANISELKARQWEVTKWGALANVAWAGLSAQLFKGNDDALTVLWVADDALTVLWVATLVVTLLCFGSIVFAQIAMLKERRTSNQALEKTPDEEAKKIYGVYGKRDLSIWKDIGIWGGQIFVLALSFLVLSALLHVFPFNSAYSRSIPGSAYGERAAITLSGQEKVFRPTR